MLEGLGGREALFRVVFEEAGEEVVALGAEGGERGAGGGDAGGGAGMALGDGAVVPFFEVGRVDRLAVVPVLLRVVVMVVVVVLGVRVVGGGRGGHGGLEVSELHVLGHGG